MKTTIPCPISPVLLECPEQDCSKKYKHANGLKYHQSHAHGLMLDEDSLQPPESPGRQPPSATPSPAPQPTPATTPQPPVIAEPQSPATTAAPTIPSSSIPAAHQSAPTALSVTTATIAPVVPPISAAIIPEDSMLLQTATNLPAETSPQSLQSQQILPTLHTPQQHPIVAAGGSITTGIAGSVMQQQQQQQILLTPSSNVHLSDPSSLSPIPTSQLQHSAISPLVVVGGSIVQTPTRPDVQGKSKSYCNKSPTIILNVLSFLSQTRCPAIWSTQRCGSFVVSGYFSFINESRRSFLSRPFAHLTTSTHHRSTWNSAPPHIIRCLSIAH